MSEASQSGSLVPSDRDTEGLTPIQRVVEAVLGDTEQLIKVGKRMHPGIASRASAKKFDETAAVGDRFFVSVAPYEAANEAEAAMLEDRPYNRLGLRLKNGNSIRTGRDEVDIARRRPVISATEEELALEVEAQHAAKAEREDLVASHELGEGAPVLVNEFGGLNIYDIDGTAHDLVLRAVLARTLGAKDVGDLVEMGLFDDRVAQRFNEGIAQLFRQVAKNLDVLTQLPQESLSLAGPPILEHSIEQAREFLKERKFAALALAIAAHDYFDVKGAEFLISYREPNFDNDYTYDAIRNGKQGYRGTKISE